jgi:hypothetical protein
LIFKYLLRTLFAKSLTRDAQGLAGYLVDEYAKVLNRAELESFFGTEEAQHPALPIDLDQLSGVACLLRGTGCVTKHCIGGYNS